MNSVLTKDNVYADNRKKASKLSILFSPIFLLIVLLVLQLILIDKLEDVIEKNNLYIIFAILNIMSVLYLVNAKNVRNEYKITWMIVFMAMPGFGILIYAIFRIIDLFNKGRTKLKHTIEISKEYYDNNCNEYINELINQYRNKTDDITLKDINSEIVNEISFFEFFNSHSYIPTYRNTDLKYFNDGKVAFDDILESMRNAKKFIFIEIFILSDGIVWREMLNILKEKVKEGVEVRLMFDGLNGIASFGTWYCKKLSEYGINAKVFKPISPILSVTQNHRDHRKIFIIDNEIAYTGGINIADEYANLYERFGQWKDSAIKIIGNAVQSLTIMFLQVWYISDNTSIYEFKKFLPKYSKQVETASKTALVTPYTDYPGLSENISFNIYSYMLHNAKKYMYIMTPYLVINEEMIDALESAVKRGVDIRIIVPHIQDKKTVSFVNKSYYKNLTLAGVKIYEYLPGFIHSKCYLQDDIRAVVGTANFDYRSLFLHYENGIYYYADDDAISDLKQDFEETFKECKEMTLSEIEKIPVLTRILGSILRIFAPLM